MASSGVAASVFSMAKYLVPVVAIGFGVTTLLGSKKQEELRTLTRTISEDVKAPAQRLKTRLTEEIAQAQAAAKAQPPSGKRRLSKPRMSEKLSENLSAGSP